MKLSLQKKFKEITNLANTFNSVIEEGAQKVLYNKDRSYLTYQVPSDTHNTYEQDLLEKVMLLPIKELPSISVDILFKITCALDQDGLFLTHVLTGDSKGLSKYFETVEIKHIFGATIYENKELPEDTILLIISDKKSGDIPDFKLVLKAHT